MALDPPTASRRIKAAREAVGLDQDGIGERFVALNLGKHDIGKIERMDPTAPEFGQGRIDALVKITGFPVEWFTEPDLQKVFSAPEPAEVDQLRRELLDEVDAAKAELNAEFDEVWRALGQPRPQPKPEPPG